MSKALDFIAGWLRKLTAGTYTLTYRDSGYILIDASGGNVTINLPPAAVPSRFHFRRIDASGNSVTINCAGADLIESAASVTMTGNVAEREVISDGLKWYASLIQEQGNFTPTARGTGTTGTFTYTAQSGQYQRIGNRVHFAINIGWSATTATGNIRIGFGTLPHALTGNQIACAVRADGLSLGAGKQFVAFATSTNNEIVLQALDPSGAATADVPMDTVVGQIMISGSFVTSN